VYCCKLDDPGLCYYDEENPGVSCDDGTVWGSEYKPESYDDVNACARACVASSSSEEASSSSSEPLGACCWEEFCASRNALKADCDDAGGDWTEGKFSQSQCDALCGGSSSSEESRSSSEISSSSEESCSSSEESSSSSDESSSSSEESSSSSLESSSESSSSSLPDYFCSYTDSSGCVEITDGDEEKGGSQTVSKGAIISRDFESLDECSTDCLTAKGIVVCYILNSNQCQNIKLDSCMEQDGSIVDSQTTCDEIKQGGPYN
jgi:hypothetical protein